MPNANKPQEFEIFELLFNPDLNFFKERMQSFVNQILDYMHAPGKEGFFPHLFLGNAVALLSTRLNEQKIHAKKIYYSFDNAKTLKIIVAASEKKNDKEINQIFPFIFTEDIKEYHKEVYEACQDEKNKNKYESAYRDKFEFTESQINSVIKKDVNSSPKIEKVTVVEIIKNYALEFKKTEPEDEDVKPRIVYFYKKDNDLYFKAKNILEEIKVKKISATEISVDFDILKFTTDKKYRSDNNPNIKNFLLKKGYPFNKKNDDDDFSITVNAYRQNVNKEKNIPKEFKEITARLEARETRLEDYIAKMSTSNEFATKENFEYILAYVQRAHFDLKIDENAYGSGAREANQDGFLVGVFQMDRYRDNIRIFIEQLVGPGLADTILLTLGPNRVSDSVPILIEHKAGIRDLPDLAPSVALSQSEEYAKGLSSNRMRFLTTAEKALCVGINFDYKDYKFKLIESLFKIIGSEKGRKSQAIKEINDSKIGNDLKKDLQDIIDKGDFGNKKKEMKEKILDALTFKSKIVNSGISRIDKIIESILDKLDKIKKQKDIGTIKSYIKEQLERVYYGFPGTRSGRSNHCFSRFLLGYSSIIDNLKYKKYVFIYDESITIKTDNRPVVTTVVFVSQEVNGKVVVMNFIEGNDNSREEFKKIKIPIDKLENLPVNFEKMKVIETNLFFDITKKNKSSDFFEGFKKNEIIEHENLGKYINHHNKDKNFFKGDFIRENTVVVPDDFDEKISDTLSSELSISWEDFFKEVSKIIFPFRDLIKNEYDFQAVLDGIFCSYSDRKLSDKKTNESVVLTEYQTGLGNRIDMIIHQKGNPIIGLELKIAEESTSDRKLQEAEEQINKKYEKSVTYKVLEDIDINKSELNTIKFIGVVFVRNAFSEEKLIKCSKDITPVEIKHSSIAFMGHEPPPDIIPSTSRTRPKIPRRDSTDRPDTSGVEPMETDTDTVSDMDVTESTPDPLRQALSSSLEDEGSNRGGGSGRTTPYLPWDGNMFFPQDPMNKR